MLNFESHISQEIYEERSEKIAILKNEESSTNER
jgi:hypothetical protein